MSNTITTRQIIQDFTALKAEVATKKDEGQISLGKFKIDTFFSRVDNDPSTRDTVIATRTQDNKIMLVSYDEFLQGDASTLGFTYSLVDLLNVGAQPQTREVVIDAASAKLVSDKGSAELTVTQSSQTTAPPAG
jgi:hypothetical protein